MFRCPHLCSNQSSVSTYTHTHTHTHTHNITITHTCTPKYIYTIRTTPVKSTAVAEPEVEEEVKAAVYQPTRFDRIEILQRKEHAKVSEADVDALSFSYDDFQSAVTNTEYSFEPDAIVKGCAIEY